MVGVFRYTVGGDYDASSSSEIYVRAGVTLASVFPTSGWFWPVDDSIFYITNRDFDAILQTAGGDWLKPTGHGIYFDFSDYGDIVLEFEGSDFGDVIIGNDINNRLHGGAGDDLLIGGWLLDGGNGDDVLIGRSIFQNVLEGGSGNDTTSYEGEKTGVYVNLKTGVADSGAYCNDRLQDIENIKGSRWSDKLIGDDGDNILHDGGLGGHDLLAGGLGDDIYYVYNADDRITERQNGGLDRVAIGTSFALGDGAYVEYFNTTSVHGTTSLDLTGNKYAQVIRGNAGSNVIDGKGGADIIFGMGGSDTFLFSQRSGGTPKIMDFVVGEDRIALDQEFFTELAVGTLGTAIFKDNTLGLRDADDRIIYNAKTGSLFYDADGTGSQAAIKFATLGPGLALTAADFLVI